MKAITLRRCRAGSEPFQPSGSSPTTPARRFADRRYQSCRTRWPISARASDGISDFNAVHSRERDQEAQFYAFDALAGDGDDYRNLPLFRRKSNLARLLARRTEGIFIAQFEQSEFGPNLFRHACMMGLEGLVSKRRDRPCRGERSKDWIKVKNRTHPAVDPLGKDRLWIRCQRSALVTELVSTSLFNRLLQRENSSGSLVVCSVPKPGWLPLTGWPKLSHQQAVPPRRRFSHEETTRPSRSHPSFPETFRRDPARPRDSRCDG